MYTEKQEPGKILYMKSHFGEGYGCFETLKTFLAMLVLPFLLFIAFQGSEETTMVVSALFFLLFLGGLFIPGDAVVVLSADNDQKYLVLKVRKYWWLGRNYKWPISQISAFSLQHRRDAYNAESTAKEKEHGLLLSFSLSWKPDSGETRSKKFSMALNEIGTYKQLFDWGLYLAQILQLPRSHIEKNDPCNFQVQFTKGLQEGIDVQLIRQENVEPTIKSSPSPAVLHEPAKAEKTPASLPVALDVASAANTPLPLIAEAWDPSRHSFDSDVIKFIPGQCLVIDYAHKIHSLGWYWGHSLSWFGCLLMSTWLIVALCANPMTYEGSQRLSNFLFYGMGIVLVSSLIWATGYWSWQKSCRYRRPAFWEFDFVKKQLCMHRDVAFPPYYANPIPLQEAKEVILRRYFYPNEKTYSAQIILVGIPGFHGLIVGRTEKNQDGNKIYQSGLAFAHLWVKELGVSFWFEDGQHPPA